MKALTLWQPYASAIALGFKTVETRPPWAMRLRALVGEDLAIHAAVRDPLSASIDGWRVVARGGHARRLERYVPGRPIGEDAVESYPLPLGQIVAIARVEAVLPMVSAVDEAGYEACIVVHDDSADLWSPAGQPEHEEYAGMISTVEETAWGDYGVGRVGILLGDVRALCEPVAVRGFQQAWTVPAPVEARVKLDVAVVARRAARAEAAR